MPSDTIHPQFQFATLDQQGEAAQLGMWIFLTTETLFFGALVFTYFLYRISYPVEIEHAARNAVLWCGSINVGLLLTSSLTMVLAINAAARGRQRQLVLWLAATAGLGLVFLGVKAVEYYIDYTDHVVPAVNYVRKAGEGPAGVMFWIFYFVATGLHAIHLSIGIGAVLYMLRRAVRRELTPAYYVPLEVVGLYWSFVDAVWLFLYPSIYLAGRG